MPYAWRTSVIQSSVVADWFTVGTQLTDGIKRQFVIKSEI